MDTGSKKPPIHILLVEDDMTDVEAIQRAFSKFNAPYPYSVATNGLDALTCLRTALQPHIVLLDLNLPVMDGFEFLSEVRRDPKLRHTVVFVLSTSDRQQDVLLAYRQFVAGYIVKSHVAPSYRQVVDLLNFFTETMEIPHYAHLHQLEAGRDAVDADIAD